MASKFNKWTSLDSVTIGYTYITPLVPGTFYTFKVIAVNKYGVGVDSPTDRDRLVRPLAPNAADPRAVVPTAYFKKRKKKQVTILFESHQNRQESEIVYT